MYITHALFTQQTKSTLQREENATMWKKEMLHIFCFRDRVQRTHNEGDGGYNGSWLAWQDTQRVKHTQSVKAISFCTLSRKTWFRLWSRGWGWQFICWLSVNFMCLINFVRGLHCSMTPTTICFYVCHQPAGMISAENIASWWTFYFAAFATKKIVSKVLVCVEMEHKKLRTITKHLLRKFPHQWTERNHCSSLRQLSNDSFVRDDSFVFSAARPNFVHKENMMDVCAISFQFTGLITCSLTDRPHDTNFLPFRPNIRPLQLPPRSVFVPCCILHQYCGSTLYIRL